jgi:hypothetical protein
MPVDPQILQMLADAASMANNCGNHEQAQAKHAALKEDAKTWASLEYAGLQGCGDYDLEMRNCPDCGSTLCIKVNCQKRSAP